MIRIFLTISILSLYTVAFASGGHHAEGIPPVIYYQALNVFAVLLILHFFARKPIQQMFVERRREFEVSLEKAKEAKQFAEKENNEIKMKLDAIRAEEKTSIDSANLEVEKLVASIAKASEEAAAHIAKEAEKSLQHEVEKAKRMMRDEMLGLALDSARKALNEQMKPEDQNRLQEEFSSRLRVVE